MGVLYRKRAAAKQQIERYYYQLIEGCGRENCTNENCASSSSFVHKSISNNEAAVKAIDLFKGRAVLCEGQPVKVAKSAAATDDPNQGTSASEVSVPPVISENTSASGDPGSSDCAQGSMDCLSTPENTSAEPKASGSASCSPVVETDDVLESSGQSISLAHALAQLAPVSKVKPDSPVPKTMSDPNCKPETSKLLYT